MSRNPAGGRPSTRPTATMERLAALQRDTFRYFLDEANPENGLVPDSSEPRSDCSIAAVGLALGCYPVAVERGFVARPEAAARVLTTLRTFARAPQGAQKDAAGYRGFFYHFLDMTTGLRARRCELSTIDTAILLAGALSAAAYFDADGGTEREIRTLAEELYRNADWQWALNGGDAVTHGWKPGSGFLRYRWQGYDEALLLYVLGLGSPTYPLPEASYLAWESTYKWRKLYGIEFLYGGPLFIHLLPQCWLDLRGIQDRFMRAKGIDYFENSRRATVVQQRYAIRNPRGLREYGEHVWGITASDGPGPAVRQVDGTRRRFYAYSARGVPWGLDDGTLSPWAVLAAIPFAPEIALPAVAEIDERHPELAGEYGFKCTFNPTFGAADGTGWVSNGHYGIDQGPVVMMLENHWSELPWRLMRETEYVVTGLRRAGFTGGWLDDAGMPTSPEGTPRERAG